MDASTSAPAALDAPNTTTPTQPIVVGSQHYNQIISTLNQHKITEYTLKLTSIGIRITLSDIDQYNFLLQVLKSPTHALRYFTHDNKEKPLKIVLKGLATQPNFNNIKDALAEINLSTVDIKQMTIKKPSFPNQANFLIYFPKAATNINDIRKIKKIGNVSVTWENYRSTNGPTQCHNCQMFGHGSRNCTLAPKCVKCSGNHRTNVCSTDCDVNDKKHLRCVNCNQNHAASFSQCPTRMEYVNMRQRQSRHHLSPAVTGTNQANRRSPMNINTDISHFPPLQPPKHQSFSNKLRSLQTPPAYTDPNALFSNQELLQIFQQLTTKLKTCKSRMEQISTITELAINYCLMP